MNTIKVRTVEEDSNNSTYCRPVVLDQIQTKDNVAVDLILILDPRFKANSKYEQLE